MFVCILRKKIQDLVKQTMTKRKREKRRRQRSERPLSCRERF